MKIKDFCDMAKFEEIMSNWAHSTGLATVEALLEGRYCRKALMRKNFGKLPKS